jgi:hypothetical protein
MKETDVTWRLSVLSITGAGKPFSSTWMGISSTNHRFYSRFCSALAALCLWCAASAQVTRQLSWDINPTATGYRIYCSTNNFTSPIMATSATVVTVGVGMNVPYRFYVTSTNSVGESPPSNIVTNTPTPPPSPLVITAPVISGNTNFVISKTVTATATVQNNTGAPFQVLEASITAREPGATNPGGPFDDFSPSMPPQTLAVGQGFALTASWLVRSNAPLGQWRVYFAVKGTNGWNDGPNTAFNVVALPAPPTAPTNLRITQVNGNRYDLDWTAKLIYRSVIERAPPAGSFTQLASVVAGTLHYSTTIKPHESWMFRVKSCDAVCSEPSNTVLVRR